MLTRKWIGTHGIPKLGNDKDDDHQVTSEVKKALLTATGVPAVNRVE